METDGLLVSSYSISREDIEDWARMRCRSDPKLRRVGISGLISTCSVPLSVCLLIALFDLAFGLSLIGFFAIGLLVYTRGRPMQKMDEEAAKRIAEEWEQLIGATEIVVSLWDCGAGQLCVKSELLEARIPLAHVYRMDESPKVTVIEPNWGPTILVPRNAFSSQATYDSLREQLRERLKAQHSA